MQLDSFNDLIFSYCWKFQANKDPQIVVQDSLKPVLTIIKDLNNYVNKIEWNNQEALISYNIPETITEEISTADFIQFLIFNCFDILKLQFNSKENEKVFTVNGIIDNSQPCNWNLNILQSDSYTPLKLNITYKLKSVYIS